ncbi:MAG: Mrp/NBP35 family ATP-binding protein [Actinomycetota bacterium]|nr:Mrp/NBP35 family ATP-binding protein [Actinomycetota bacterium]
MPTIEQIRSVLATINDPEIRRSIVELGMVKGIEVANGLVTVDLALTIPGCPLKSFFLEVLPAKLKASFPEVHEVKVNLGAMTADERKALVGGVKGEQSMSLAHPASSTTVLAVGSGKGGVGKSSIAVNLAAGLAARNRSVGLLDADIWGFSSSRLAGNDTRPTVIDDLIMPPEVYGFRMISMGNLVEDDRPIPMRGPMLHKILQQFLGDVHWGDPEYLIIDMPPGTGDISISLSQFVPGCTIILVTTPQQAAEKVAERAGHMAYKVGMKVGGVIENMAYLECPACGERSYPFGQGGGELLAQTFDAPLLGQIPLDPPMRELADRGKPTVVAAPESPSGRAFAETIDQVVARFPSKPKSRPKTTLPLIVQPPRAPVGRR